MNKKVMLLFIGESKGENILPQTNFTRKYLTVNFFQLRYIVLLTMASVHVFSLAHTILALSIIDKHFLAPILIIVIVK